MLETCMRSLALILVISGASFADEWPQWRGKHRDGKSTESNLLDQWPADGPKLLWQQNGLGQGYSTPSAAGGQLVFLRNEDESNEEVVALALADGSQNWATRIGAVGKNRGPQYPGTRSTPTFDGDTIYALGSDGDLACLDAQTGNIKWSKSLTRDYSGKPGNWAYAESPLVDGDLLLVSPGGASATVVALNKKDGSTIWKSALAESDDASFSSPVVAVVDGVKQYVFFLAKGVVGVDAKTGEQLWRYRRTVDEAANIQTPVVRGNLVYTAASRVGGGLVQVAGGKSEPQEVYFKQTVPKGIGGSILVGENLFGSSGATLVCVDFTTGEIQWQNRSIGAASLCYADEKLYLHGENNQVAMVAAIRDEYRELGRFTPPNAPDRGRSKAWTYPIIVDGRLIIRDVGTIWCYDIRG